MTSRSGEIRKLGVGMIGYAFMGKAHANARETVKFSDAP